ncbi:hypothetical protein LQG66_03985 [Bradyrhizobium ontarionense]|uniref:Uncharacterized protein n=1 Tax=Bradyrhizobium ontarionense TaxID=2898149 RepID=A0ABY3REQ6_9BRAD|nr:hypothetical protein [Bradyrhizobium sp. A19]UFZ05487.1 hypothetical protein LQG66_03985 [Bradyrhizobium sp. A19]
MSSRRLRVCDHALLRFVERVGGLDVEALRKSLEGSLNRCCGVAAAIGAAEMVIVADGLKYIVVKNVVVTVLSPEMKAKRQTRRPGKSR